MVFNPVFFETNESSELSYFARPQKISNANYLFADIMNVYSKKGGPVATGFGKPASAYSNNNEKFPVWAGDLESEQILKLTKTLGGLFAESNFPKLLDANTQKRITKEQLTDLLGKIKNILSKGKNAGLDLSGMFDVLQQGVVEGKEIKLLFDDGANGVSVKIVQLETPENNPIAGEESISNFIIKINQLIGNQKNSDVYANKATLTNANSSVVQKGKRTLSSGLVAIVLANPPENEISDSHVVLNKLASTNNFERLLKETVSVKNNKNGKSVSQQRLGVIIKKLSTFIKAVKTEIHLSGKSMDEKVDNINVLIQNITTYLQTQPKNKFMNKLADELNQFENNIAKLNVVNVAKNNRTAINNSVINGTNAKLSEVKSFISSIEQELKEISKAIPKKVDNTTKPFKDTLSKVNITKSVKTVNEKLTKLNSVISEIVNELGKAEESGGSRLSSTILPLQKKGIELQNLINTTKQGLREISKTVTEINTDTIKPMKETLSKVKVTKTVKTVNEKLTKLSSEISEIVNELGKAEESGESRFSSPILSLQKKGIELEKLINTTKQGLREISKTVAETNIDTIKPMQETLSKVEVAKTVNRVNEKLTKLSSEISEIVNELINTEESGDNETLHKLSSLKTKISEPKNFVHSSEHELEKISKVKAEMPKPVKETVQKVEVSKTINTVNDKLTKVSLAVSEIVNKLEKEKSGQSEILQKVSLMQTKVSKIRTFVQSIKRTLSKDEVTKTIKLTGEKFNQLSSAISEDVSELGKADEIVNLKKSVSNFANAEQKNSNTGSISNQIGDNYKNTVKQINRLIVKINSLPINDHEFKLSINDLSNKIEKYTVSDNAETTQLVKSIISEIKRTVGSRFSVAQKKTTVKKITSLVSKLSDLLVSKDADVYRENKQQATDVQNVVDKTRGNLEIDNFEHEVDKAVTKLESKFVSAILEEKESNIADNKLSAPIVKSSKPKTEINETTAVNNDAVKSKMENKTAAKDGHENKNSSSEQKDFPGAQVEHVADNDKDTKFSEKLNSINITHSNTAGKTFYADNTVANELSHAITKEDLIKNFSEIVKSAKEKSITLQLKPVELGKIKVTLSMLHNDSVKANIQVENHVIKQFVENNISQLYAQLGKSGLQFASVDVSVSQNPFAKESKYGSNGHKKQKGGNTFNGNIPLEEDNSKAREFGYNTYEYLV
jgi:flagellar hook-length control protein FliK